MFSLMWGKIVSPGWQKIIGEGVASKAPSLGLRLHRGSNVVTDVVKGKAEGDVQTGVVVTPRILNWAAPPPDREIKTKFVVRPPAVERSQFSC